VSYYSPVAWTCETQVGACCARMCVLCVRCVRALCARCVCARVVCTLCVCALCVSCECIQCVCACFCVPCLPYHATPYRSLCAPDVVQVCESVASLALHGLTAPPTRVALNWRKHLPAVLASFGFTDPDAAVAGEAGTGGAAPVQTLSSDQACPPPPRTPLACRRPFTHMPCLHALRPSHTQTQHTQTCTRSQTRSQTRTRTPHTLHLWHVLGPARALGLQREGGGASC
jgi:hypothetical protein